MFNFVHKNKRLLQFVLALLIVPPFAFWGIQWTQRDVGAANEVADVDGQKITEQDFATQLRQQQDRMRQLLGGRLDPAAFDTPEAREQMLEGMISQRLLTRDVVKKHLSSTDDNLRELIASTPAFQDSGKFSQERYLQALQAEGYSPQQFEASLRRDLLVQQLSSALAEANIVSRAVAREWANLAGERREVSQTLLQASSFAPQVRATPEAVQAFYEANRSLFGVPEQVHAEYVVLNADSLLALDPVTTEEIRAQYDARREQYEQKEQRQASHVLISVKPGSSDADKARARAKAEEIAAQVKKNPAAFAEVAKKQSEDPGSAPKGGDLGLFSRGMMVQQFEEAVFRMKPGEIAGPVESDFGFHVIKLVAVRPGKLRPLEEVRGEIEKDLRKQRAGRKFAEAAEQFSNIAYEQPDSLKPAADKFRLAVQDAGWVTRAQSRAQPLNNSRMLSALFSEDAIKNRRNTEAIEVAPGVLVVARVNEHKDAAVRQIEEVRGEVVNQLVRKESAALAWKQGEEKLALLKKGEAVSLPFGPARTIGRDGSKELGPDAAAAAFRADRAKLPAYAGPAQAGQTLPAFRTTLADGRAFTEQDLQDGAFSVLVFFRGRW